MKSSPFESQKAMEIALREGIKNGDLNSEDVVFYSMVNRLTASTRSIPVPVGSVTSDWGTGGTSAVMLDEAGRGQMYRDSRRIVRDDSMAGNVLMKYMMHVSGRGLKISLKPTLDEEGKPVPHKKADLLDDIYPDGAAEETARMLIAQTLTNGSIFVLHLPLDSMFREKVNDFETVGYPQMRAILPDHVRKIVHSDSWSFTSPPSQYQLSTPFKKIFPNGIVQADNMTHLRIFQEWNDGIWGLSLFYRFNKEIMRYVDWLEQRAFKARADNLVYLFRMREGAQSGKKYELPDKPMMIDLNAPNEDVKAVGLNTGSGSDARGGDGYEFRLRCAQAVHLPEHEVTENAQYAAQIGKFGFPTRMYEYIQNNLDGALKRVFAKTLGVPPTEVMLEWPRVDTRDRAQIVSEVTSLEKDHDISKAEVRRVLSYDDRNKDEINQELNDSMSINPAGSGSMFGMPDNSGMPSGFSGLGDIGSAGGASPSPAGANPQPQPKTAEPSIPGLRMSMPASYWPRLSASIDPESFAGKLRTMEAISDFGMNYEVIVDTIPEPGLLTLATVGADYGYASEGAAIVGGMDENEDIWIVGEMTFKRVPSAQWATAFGYAQERYPSIKEVYTGSDEPELTDELNKNGIRATAKHLGEDRTKLLISAFLDNHKIFIHQDCVELLTDLFQAAAESIGGMDSTKSRVDHKDAFRYLMIGLLESSKMIESIGSPEGGELIESPEAV